MQLVLGYLNDSRGTSWAKEFEEIKRSEDEHVKVDEFVRQMLIMGCYQTFYEEQYLMFLNVDEQKLQIIQWIKFKPQAVERSTEKQESKHVWYYS